jgi:serine O-acetyltransferase
MLLNFWLYGCEFSLKSEIGPGLFLPHPNGVVLGALRIGSNCVIAQQVTLGKASVDPDTINDNKRPIIGNEVFIGPGAKVLGSVEIPDRANIPANKVVTLRTVNELKIRSL